MRISLRATSLLVAALAALSCTDAPTGPGGSGTDYRAGKLALAPGFSPSAERAYLALAQIGVDITSVRVRLVNAAGILVLDTTAEFPADQETLDLPLQVPIDGIEETFTATIELRDANGVVLFSSTRQVTARDVRLPDATPPKITLEFVGPGATASVVSVSPATGTVAASANQTLTASATEAGGAPVTNLLVVWTSSDTAIALVLPTSNTTAAVQQTGRRGTATFTARTLGGVSGTATLTFLPKPSRLVAVSGGAQSGAAGHELPQPFVVQLLGVDSLPVAGQSVTFRGVTAGGSVGAATATTGADGKASTLLTVGQTPGAYQFEAALGTITATVQATAVAGPASQFVVSQPLPAQLSVGAAAPLPFRATLADEFGNVVKTAGTVLSANVSVAPGGQTFSATATTDTTGSVTLALPVYLGPPGTATVVLSSPAFGTISTTTIPVVVGPAATLKIVQQPPSSAASGAPLSVAPSVQLVDVAGNPSGASAAVTVSLNGGAGATLGGTATVTTAADGSATFAGLSIGGPVGSYTLSFTTTGLPPATSNAITLGAGVAAQLVVQPGHSTSATAGSVVPAPPTVLVRDASGNPVAGVSVSFAIVAGGGTVGSPSAVTNGGGLATVDTWHLGSAAGVNTLRITVPSIPALSGTPVDVSVTGTVGAPTQFSAVSGSGPGVVGDVRSVRVKVADASGNPVAGRTVTFTAGSSSGSVAPTTVVSDASGEAAATWTLGFVVGQQTVTATPDFTAAPVSFTSAVSAGANSQLKVVAEPSSATNGVSLSPQPQVQLLDASGANAIAQAGVSVTASLLLGDGTLQGTQSVVTDATGRATFAGLSIIGPTGSYQLGFAASGFTSGTSGTFPLVAGAPATLLLQPGYSTSAVAGTVPPGPPIFKVSDATGNPVPGVSVQFAVTAGSGSIPSPVVTNASGIATADSWTLGATVGTNTLRATVASLTPADVSVQGTAGAPTQLTDVSGSGPGVTGGTTQLRVKVADVGGNPVAGRTVTFTAGGSSGSVAPTTVVSDANGEAAATWTFGFMVGQQTATAMPDFGAPPVSFTSTVAAGASSQLQVAAQPSLATNGVALSPQPQVQLVDGSGNPISQAGVSVTASLIAGSGTLQGTATATTNPSGRATFTDLSIIGPTGSYQLGFAAAAFTGTSSGTFQLAAGAPASVNFQPGYSTSATAGSIPPVPPTVLVRDDVGNPVPGVSVTFAVTAGGGSLATPVVTTNSSGLATAGSWRLGSTAGTNTLSATVQSLTPDQVSVQGVAAQMPHLAILTPPSDTTPAGTPMPRQPVIVLFDENNNRVALGGVKVTTAIATGLGSAQNNIAFTDASGAATFTSLYLLGKVGTVTLKFEASTYTGANSGPIVIVGGAPAALKIVPIPPSTAKNDVPLSPAPVVQLVDVSDNPVKAALSVTATVTPQGAAVSGTTVVALDATGRATFNNLVLSGTVASYTLRFSSPNVTAATTPITLTAGTTSSIVVWAGDGQEAPSGTTVPNKPEVRVTDRFGNGVPGVSVLFTAENGSEVDAGKGFGPTAEIGTDGSGIATLPAWRLGTTGQNTLRATVSGVGTAVFSARDVSPKVAKFVLIHGDKQKGPAGTELKDSIVVEAQDGKSEPVANAWAFVKANGCCSGTVEIVGGTQPGAIDSSRTDSQGRVTFRWTMPTNRDGGISAQIFNKDDPIGVVVTADLETENVLHLETIDDGQFNGKAGEPLPFRHVEIRDSKGDVAPLKEHITVTLLQVEGDGAFTGESITVQQTADGKTDFVKMIVSKGGKYKLRFTAPGIVPVVTREFVVD